MVASVSNDMRAVSRAVGYPVVGLLPKLWVDPLRAFEQLMRTHGDVVRFSVLGRESFLIADSDVARSILRSRDYPRTNRFLKPLLGTGLLTDDGEIWRRSRRSMQPAFHPRFLSALVRAAVPATLETIARMQRKAGASGTLDFAEEMRHLTLTIGIRRLFGTSIDPGDESELHESLQFVLAEVWRQRWRILPSSFQPVTRRVLRFRHAVNHIDQVARHLVADRRASGSDEADLLSLLLAARDHETGDPFSEEQIINEVKVTLITAHDSPSNTLAWACYSLCQHPHAAKILEHELSAVLGSEAPGLDDLPQLRWLLGVVEETMRLYPPVWLIGRDSPAEETSLGGSVVPASSHLLVCPYLIHRNPKYWEDPERFLPSRFAFELESSSRRPGYFPFGIGPHVCVGAGYGFTLVRLVLAMMWRHFSFELVGSGTVRAIGATTLTPRGGVHVRIRPRVSRSALPSCERVAHV